MFICNYEPFGYIIKPHPHPSLKAAAEKFRDFKLETLGTVDHSYTTVLCVCVCVCVCCIACFLVQLTLRQCNTVSSYLD